MKKNNHIELLNSEGPILIAKHVVISHDSGKGFLLEFIQADKFIVITVEEMRKFLKGEMKIRVDSEEVHYPSYPSSMKPDEEFIQQFLNSENGNY